MKKCCHMSQHLSIQNTISGSYHEKRGKMFIFVWVLCIFARHFYEQCICMKIFWFQGLKLCNCWCESIQTWKLNKNIYDSEIWQNMSFNDFPFLLHIRCKVSGGFLYGIFFSFGNLNMKKQIFHSNWLCETDLSIYYCFFNLLLLPFYSANCESCCDELYNKIDWNYVSQPYNQDVYS